MIIGLPGNSQVVNLVTPFSLLPSLHAYCKLADVRFKAAPERCNVCTADRSRTEQSNHSANASCLQRHNG